MAFVVLTVVAVFLMAEVCVFKGVGEHGVSAGPVVGFEFVELVGCVGPGA